MSPVPRGDCRVEGDEKPNTQTKSLLSTKRRGGISSATRGVFMTHSTQRTGKTGEITAVERLFSINIYLFFQRNSLNISLTQSKLICLHIPGSIWRQGNPASLISSTHVWPTGKLPLGQLQIRTCKDVTVHSLRATLCAFRIRHPIKKLPIFALVSSQSANFRISPMHNVQCCLKLGVLIRHCMNHLEVFAFLWKTAWLNAVVKVYTPVLEDLRLLLVF